MGGLSLKDQAVILLLAIFRGISADFKDRYDYKSLWEMIQARLIQAGLQARDMQTFTQKLLTWLHVDLYVSDDNAELEEILSSNSYDLLDYFRKEPSLIVYFAKVAQKEASEKRKQEKKS